MPEIQIMTTLSSTLDHLVIAASTLTQGLDFCEEFLGIRPPKGGRHVRMGTHNHLLYSGDNEFIEIIAIDSRATQPQQSRWFGLDAEEMQARLHIKPYLATFVARTGDIAAAFTALPEIGSVQEMQRDALQWQISIPRDGKLVENGTMPSLIQWPEGLRVTSTMSDFGYRFVKLEVYHPQPARLAEKWARIGLCSDARLSIMPCALTEKAYLVAYIDSPSGRKILNGKSAT